MRRLRRYRVLKQEGRCRCGLCSRRHVVLIAQEDATDQMRQSFLDATPTPPTSRCSASSTPRASAPATTPALPPRRAARGGARRDEMAPDGVTALPRRGAAVPAPPGVLPRGAPPGMCRIDAAKAAALDAAGLGPWPEPEETPQCPKHPACAAGAPPGLCRVDPCKAMQLAGPPRRRRGRGIKRLLGAAQGELLATAVGTPTGLHPMANPALLAAAATRRPEALRATEPEPGAGRAAAAGPRHPEPEPSDEPAGALQGADDRVKSDMKKIRWMCGVRVDSNTQN